MELFGCRTYNHKERQIHWTILSLFLFLNWSVYDRPRELFAFARHNVARFAVLDHVFMFIHYFIDTFFRSSDPSFSWFITKCLFYGCAQVTFSDEEMYLWSSCGLITRKKRNKENQHSFGVSCRWLILPWNRCLTSSEIHRQNCLETWNVKMVYNYKRVCQFALETSFSKAPVVMKDPNFFTISNFPIFHLQDHYPWLEINYPWILYQNRTEPFRDITLQQESELKSLFCLRFLFSCVFENHQVPAKSCREWKM